MRKNLAVMTILAVALIGIGGGLALAKTSGAVDIPFGFLVGDRELPAGRYQVQAKGPDGSLVAIQNLAGGEGIMVPVVTRLGDIGATSIKVVFDRTEDGKAYLAEIHIPGMDGFAVKGAPGKHTHVKISAKE